MRAILSAIVLLTIAALMSGCGAELPVMSISHPKGSQFDTFVKGIATHVRCELGRSIKAKFLNDKVRQKLMQGWAAKIALNLKVIDEGTASPSVSGFTTPMRFIGSLAGNYKADATREMTITYFVLIDELVRDEDAGTFDVYGNPRKCPVEQEDPISGELGIDQTLESALRSWDSMHVLSDHIKGGPFDTISHHVSFVALTGVTATPTWKLKNVSADTSGTLFGANRTTTDDLVITLGPSQLGSRKTDRKLASFVGGSSELDQSFFLERLKGVINPGRLGAYQ